MKFKKNSYQLILLKDIDKAHSNLLDFVLKLCKNYIFFDSSGDRIDFKNSLIIMTTSAGVVGDLAFSADDVVRNLYNIFPKELLNQVDNTVIFNPLSRPIMRKVLFSSIKKILNRRGLKDKEWILEWEDSAVNFLIEKGFSEISGASSLNGILNRHFLTPIAITLARHHFPEGKQFLLIKSDQKKIVVDFFDPETSMRIDGEQATKPAVYDFGDLDGLKKIINMAIGRPEELRLVLYYYEKLSEVIRSESWIMRKEELNDMTLDYDFWENNIRFVVLREIEYRDKVESALKSADSILSRFQGRLLCTSLISNMAQKFYLVDRGIKDLQEQISCDSYLLLRYDGEEDSSLQTALKMMYINWARKRQMRFTILEDDVEINEHCNEFLMSVTGFGGYSILLEERGIHTMEIPEQLNVEVSVFPRPALRFKDKNRTIKEARGLYDKSDPGDRADVIRKYRRSPSSLVEDVYHHWTTEDIDKVLGGDFDIIC